MKLLFFLLTITTYSHTLQACMPSSMDLYNPHYQPPTLSAALNLRSLTGQKIPQAIRSSLLYDHQIPPEEGIPLGRSSIFTPEYHHSPDGTFFAYLDRKSIVIINLQTKQSTTIQLPHHASSLLISHDSKTLFIASKLGYVACYSLLTNTLTNKEELERVSSVDENYFFSMDHQLALSSNNQFLYSFSHATTIPGRTVYKFYISKYTIQNGCISSENEEIICSKHINQKLQKIILSEQTNTLSIIDKETAWILDLKTRNYKTACITYNTIEDVTLSPDGSTILIASNTLNQDKSSIASCNLQTFQIDRWNSITDKINNIALSNCGNMLITICMLKDKKKIIFWDIKTKQIIRSIQLCNRISYLAPIKNQPGYFYAISFFNGQRYLHSWLLPA